MISICCVTDDLPGHKSQIEGLLLALKKRVEVQEQWLHIHQPAPVTTAPDLILAVGRHTHWPALKLRWHQGGKVVVLTKPQLPRWLFDLCVLPRHDGVRESRRVFNTIGSLNAIQPASNPQADCGLILLGGPSKHHGWSAPEMLAQLQQLQQLCPQIHWTLTTSRRTPAPFTEALQPLGGPNFRVVPFADTNRQWLLQRYAESGCIWVTEDSVSMVYESLSSGANVGVLEVPRKRTGRVSRNLDTLVAEGRVLTLRHLQQQGLPAAPRFPPLQEADRAAAHILQWLQDAS
ncbi:MAG: hypothetical protein GYB33_03985 [Gammaproteobacteria bacterium]|uniref:mitochondrial fission ELM1 family protein n=1 Tax=Pseudomaricurvus alcaniphilus TaxID=1166482 RepID=UPI00140A338D|nr:ELM1/GtrOC1 family putative glycosyltransferase [Pseudomaricurvus alcaniphilus]MBR9909498.1 hypothetical protein [Gammaproteobacteria bacterium]NHN37097.1 hypothetical protein [Pseudomaricurvus alcaniphilus]